MRNLKTLEEFKDFARRVHSAYSVANHSLDCLGEMLSSSKEYKEDGNYEIIDEESGQLVSAFPNSFIVSGMKRDGPISQTISFGMLSWIYSAWEKRFRRMIADELGVDKNDVMSDVMGDIRTLRHAIAHNLVRLDKDAKKKLKVLNWFSTGLIIVKSADMNKIQIHLNNMDVYVRTP